jgi:hypothetical protein
MIRDARLAPSGGAAGSTATASICSSTAGRGQRCGKAAKPKSETSIDMAGVRSKVHLRASLDNAQQTNERQGQHQRFEDREGQPPYNLNADRTNDGATLWYLIPAPPGHVINARRSLRRDVDGAIRRSRASDRRLEGERDGSRSRRPAVTACGGAPGMAPSRRPPRGTGPAAPGASDRKVHAITVDRSLQRDANRRTRGCPMATRWGRATAPLMVAE